MKPTKISIIIVLFTSSIVLLFNCSKREESQVQQNLGSSTVVSPLPDEEFAKRYIYWRDKLSLTKGLEKYAEKEMGKERRTPFWVYREASRDNEVCVEGPESIEMFFNESGEITAIRNVLIEKQVKELQKDSTPIVSQKSKKEILKQAEQYLNALVGERIKKYSLSAPEISLRDYFGPMWYIDWNRKINEYDFPADSISIMIHDECGFYCFAFRIISESCPTVVKINQKKSEEIALKTAKEARPDMKVEIGETKLIIVNPNYFFTNKLSPEWPARSSKSRLAYKVIIKWSEKKTDWRLFYVNIDAETGEILGGNMPM